MISQVINIFFNKLNTKEMPFLHQDAFRDIEIVDNLLQKVEEFHMFRFDFPNLVWKQL